jgi:hypothetical protein
MPVLYECILKGPVTHSTYVKFIKHCCVEVPSEKEYIGACVRVFKDEVPEEEKNFKLTVKSEDGSKLVRLKITGGLGAVTRTKYYIDNQKIQRYDWREGFWRVIKYIGTFFNYVGRGFRVLDSSNMALEWLDDN